MKKDRIVRVANNTYRDSVLGLDVSSATIGWGLLSFSKEIKLLSYGHIKPLDSKYDEIYRLNDTYDRIAALCEKYRPLCIAVEDIFLFMKGKSKARTITVLTAFNRVASLAGYKFTDNLNYYSVHEIRKLIKLEYQLPITIDKESMPDIIKDYLEPKFEILLNRNNNVAKETYDAADGIAVAWAYAIHKQHPEFLEKGKK